VRVDKDEMPIMKRYGICVSLLVLFAPLCASAGWQVTKPESSIPREPFFQAGSQPKTGFMPSSYSSKTFPAQYAHLGQPAPVFAISISGSLKENLERIMGRYHWKVIWKAPYDYNFDGRVTGSSLPNVVEKLLQPFPLKAVMYMSNRTLTVVTKTRT
jgi:hypothetical protein